MNILLAQLVHNTHAMPHPMQAEIDSAISNYEQFRHTLQEEVMLLQLESVVRKAATIAPLNHSKTPFNR